LQKVLRQTCFSTFYYVISGHAPAPPAGAAPDAIHLAAESAFTLLHLVVIVVLKRLTFMASNYSMPASTRTREFSILQEKLERTAASGDTLRPHRTEMYSALVDRELRAALAWNSCSTPHFMLHYESGRFENREIESILKLLEQSYTSIFSQTHEAFADRLEMFLVDARSQVLLGRRLPSHLNVEEKTLYLTKLPYQPLHQQLIEHLTHAMRMPRYAKNYHDEWALMEDAFAVFLNHRLSPQQDVFPFFGIEPDVIAHELIASKRVRSIIDCWTSPESCSIIERQVLNGAFFIYLGDTYSDDKIVELSKCDGDISIDTFKQFFGRSLEELANEWVEHLPTSLLCMTREELDHAVTRWEKKIDSYLWV
jgi:hypothetical protein